MAASNVTFQYVDGTRFTPVAAILTYDPSTSILAVQAGKHLGLSATSNFGAYGVAPIAQPSSALYDTVTPAADATNVTVLVNQLVADLKLLGLIKKA